MNLGTEGDIGRGTVSLVGVEDYLREKNHLVKRGKGSIRRMLRGEKGMQHSFYAMGRENKFRFNRSRNEHIGDDATERKKDQLRGKPINQGKEGPVLWQSYGRREREDGL